MRRGATVASQKTETLPTVGNRLLSWELSEQRGLLRRLVVSEDKRSETLDAVT